MILKNLEEVEDFVRGCTFYGTGGGGDYRIGVEVLKKQLDKGNEVGWVNGTEINDDDYTCCPFMMGSIAPLKRRAINEMRDVYGLTEEKYDYAQQLSLSVKMLEKISDKKIKALIPIELGGANAAACICAAAENNMKVIDGDYTGRAIPEIQQTTPFIFEKNLLPITSTDTWGNVAIIDKALNWRIAERIGKFLSAAAYMGCGQAGFLMLAREAKQIVIKNTMTECYKIGKLIRTCCEKGENAAEVIAQQYGGWIICRGVITKKEWQDKDGYYWGTHVITGVGAYHDMEIKIFFKNENHIMWKNEKILVTSPDMIQVIDSETFMPYTNNLLKEGMNVTVVVLRAREVFRTKRGLMTLGPRAFGYDIDYIPVEQALSDER